MLEIERKRLQPSGDNEMPNRTAANLKGHYEDDMQHDNKSSQGRLSAQQLADK